MKLINNKGIILGKISIIDLLIFIGVIVIGSVLFTMIRPDETNLTSQTKIVYTYETAAVSENFVRQLHEGAELFNSSRNHSVGTLVSFESKPLEIETKDINKGDFFIKTVEGEYIVVMVIEAFAVESAHHYYVTQEDIKIGITFPIKGKGFATKGTVIGLEEVNE